MAPELLKALRAERKLAVGLLQKIAVEALRLQALWQAGAIDEVTDIEVTRAFHESAVAYAAVESRMPLLKNRMYQDVEGITAQVHMRRINGLLPLSEVTSGGEVEE